MNGVRYKIPLRGTFFQGGGKIFLLLRYGDWQKRKKTLYYNTFYRKEENHNENRVEMKKIMLSGKIHTATITRCLVDYEGSLEIDPELLAEAGILPYEKILVANRNNGSRLETYAIPGVPGSKDFCLNGPAARLGKVGDVVTIMAFSVCDEKEAETLKPRIIVLGEGNKIKMRRRGRDMID